MKGRIEAIARTRASISDLGEKYGFSFGEHQQASSERRSVYKEAIRLGLTRQILTPAKTVILCAAELKDASRADPCLIVPAALPIELLPPHKTTAVGGQLVSLTRTAYALPKYVMDAAWRAHGYWQGALLPVLVSINGEYRYLVRPNSYFFRFGPYTGSDLDVSSPGEPNDVDLKLGRYHWGDDLADELTVLIADF